MRQHDGRQREAIRNIMNMRTEAVVQRITKAIFQHRVPPGARLDERGLAAAFGTSRTVIRQALIRLAESGLVVIEPHRGAFVIKPTLEEAHLISEAQIMIEKALIEAVIDKATPADLMELRRHTAREKEADDSGNHALADELGVEFHILLSRILRNPNISKIHTELMLRQRVISGVFKTDFDYCQLRGEHDALINAIEAGSVKKAHKLIEAHYRLLIKGHVVSEADTDPQDWDEVFREPAEPEKKTPRKDRRART